MTDKGKLEKSLSGVDKRKRSTLIRLGLGAAFVTPIVASFSMDGLTISKVHAASANGSGVNKRHFTDGGNMTDGGNQTTTD
jgi:hypothetical protein